MNEQLNSIEINLIYNRIIVALENRYYEIIIGSKLCPIEDGFAELHKGTDADLSELDLKSLDDKLLNFFDAETKFITEEIDDKHAFIFKDSKTILNDEYQSFDMLLIRRFDVMRELLEELKNRVLNLTKEKIQRQSENNTGESKKNTLKHQGNQINPVIFNELFKVVEWDKYLLVLTKCSPPLLEKNDNGSYKFIGNKKTQRGCVAQWFKYLKDKGIIDQSTNRDELAAILTSNIENYSINGSSIDNNSKTYASTFEKKLNDLISIS